MRPRTKSIARRTLKFYKGVVDQFEEEINTFGNAPSMYAGLVDARGRMQLYDGMIRFKDAAGATVTEVERLRTSSPPATPTASIASARWRA